MQINRFIKYKALPYLIIYFKNRAYNKTPLVILALGISIFPSFGLFPYLIQILFSQSEYGDYINIIAIIISISLITFALYWIHRQMVNREKGLNRKSKVVFKQFSIDSSEKNNTPGNIKEEVYVTLDQRPKNNETNLEWMKNSLIKQRESIEDYFYVAERWDQPESQYEGLAHIPYVFLLGYQVSNKRNFTFSEWDENNLKWEVLPEEINYPKLELVKDLVSKNFESSSEVNILISLTEEIKRSQLSGIPAFNNDNYHLKLRNCKRHAIKSKTQLSEYKQQFRSLLDDINRLYSNNLQRVNIFISAQTSLVFNIGSAITRNDKDVFIYNFEGKNTINYPWALKVHKKTNPNNINSYIEIHEVGYDVKSSQ
ncbi:SAVED domain-containing protein [Evansella halocellulosilytica]|uniref:SAVED domain-containing protein n=1 Tax=Evansella halocellulosilytica TaxID=2011013 RepID=UPI000BB79FA7|nr:SAVED domain-containing protein [Evansella halocellulosilytica]